MGRIKTVERDAGWGWIARNPFTGEEIMPDFRWSSRAVARTVVLETRLLASPTPPEGNDGERNG